MTQAPMATICPDSSAMGMNCAGGTGPSSALCQRSSASTQISSPLWASMRGW
jgi:hypothetical protein